MGRSQRFIIGSIGIALIAAALTAGGNAFAALGDSARSMVDDERCFAEPMIQSDVLAHKKPQARAERTLYRLGYTIHEMAFRDFVVQEYVSFTGTIFAISWHGRQSPEPPCYTGRYYDDYQKGMDESFKRQPSHVMPSRTIDTGKIVVEYWGIIGDYNGRAFVPSLLPWITTRAVIKPPLYPPYPPLPEP